MDEKAANKKNVDETSREGIVFRFDATFERYLKVSLGDTVHNLRKYDKEQLTDTKKSKFPKQLDIFYKNRTINVILKK